MKKLSFLSISSVGYLEISFSYRPRIKPVSFPYHPPIVLLSFSLLEAETIRKQYEADILWKGGRYEDEA